MFMRSLKVAFVAALAAAGITAVSVDASVKAFRNVQEGQPAPGFTLMDLSGNEVPLAPGKVTVVVFVRADKNSEAALSDLKEVHAKLAPKGVDFMGVLSETDQKNQMAEFVQKEAIPFPVLADEGRKVYGEWGTFLYPTTAILDKEGKLSVHVSSHNRKYKETVLQNVRVAMGEITKEQMAEMLNPKEMVKLTDEQKKAERHMNLARKLVERKLYEKAAAEYALAVESDPNLAEAKVQYGFLLLKTGDAAKARENFGKAMELDPKDEDAKAGLGAAMVAQGEADKGIELLVDALKLNPRPARAHFELGKAWEKKGDSGKAAENYKRAAELLGGW